MADITVKGTAFSTDAVAGDIFYRTDIFNSDGGWCRYDGTQWFTCATETYQFVQATATTDGTSNTVWAGGIGAVYVESVAIRTTTAGTVDTDNYWTVTAYGANTAGATSVICAITTDSDTSATATRHDVPQLEAFTDNTPANYGQFHIGYAATGTPGNLTYAAAVKVRRIVT